MTFHRRFAVAVARLLVAVMAVVSLGPLVHMEAGHDTDCEPQIVVHDHTKHGFTDGASPQAPLQGDHCVVCHWGRSFRGPVSWASLSSPTLDARVQAVEPARQAPSAPLLELLSARAPPQIAG